jgi:iron-sulfur cluster repair protein YtfE (RIC family)
MIYINCHSAGNYLKVSAAVLNQTLPFYACNYFRALFFSTMHQKKRFLLKDKNTGAHIMRKIYTNCHSAGNYLKVSTAVLNQALPFCACNYFRALYQLYLLNSPKLFNKFTMVNADTT